MPAKKAAAKKASAKKSAKKTTASATLAGSKLSLELPLNASRVAAIKRCLAKGTLKVTFSRVDLGKGRLGDPYLYD